MKLRLPLSAQEVKPDNPKYPTSDFAYDMAVAVTESKKVRKRKRKNKDFILNGVDTEV